MEKDGKDGEGWISMEKHLACLLNNHIYLSVVSPGTILYISLEFRYHLMLSIY